MRTVKRHRWVRVFLEPLAITTAARRKEPCLEALCVPCRVAASSKEAEEYHAERVQQTRDRRAESPGGEVAVNPPLLLKLPLY